MTIMFDVRIPVPYRDVRNQLP